MKDQNNPDFIPEITSLGDLSKYFNLPPFPYEHFWFLKIEDEKDFFGAAARPLRHRLYAISFITECKGTLSAGFWKVHPQKPALFIKTPYQVVSWEFEPLVKRKYIVVFSETFIAEHPSLANLIFDFPFFQLDKAIPFEVEEKDVTTLANVFENIGMIYDHPSPEQFNILAGYVRILLLHIREMYDKYVFTDTMLAETISHSDDRASNGFFTLVKRQILAPTGGDSDYSVASFAAQLDLHPNHLSAILKRQTGKTAQEHIHDALIGAAKTLLVQTDLTMKEVAYRLSFKEPAHFANFFKKMEGITPLQYKNAHRH